MRRVFLTLVAVFAAAAVFVSASDECQAQCPAARDFDRPRFQSPHHAAHRSPYCDCGPRCDCRPRCRCGPRSGFSFRFDFNTRRAPRYRDYEATPRWYIERQGFFPWNRGWLFYELEDK